MMRRPVFLLLLASCVSEFEPIEGEASAIGSPCSSTTLPTSVWPVTCQPVDAAGATLCATNTADHYVGRPDASDAALQERLIVFLTGDQSVPSQSQRLLRTFVRQGFRTIGLSYDTDDAALALEPCKLMTDLADAQACYAENRNRRLYGIHDPAFAYNTVATEDAVEPRLVALLQHLDATDPDGEWYRFLHFSRTRPFYPEIVLVGWSYGAGLVLELGRDRSIQAGILLDGMKDPFDGYTQNASVTTGLTPGCRFFGVYDANQNGVDLIVDQWTSGGMLWASSETGESIDGSLTSTAGLAQSNDRRFQTAHLCPSKHASFAVDAFLYQTIDLTAPVSCAVGSGGNYQLRGLYEAIACHAAHATCTGSHDTTCTSGAACYTDAPL